MFIHIHTSSIYSHQDVESRVIIRFRAEIGNNKKALEAIVFSSAFLLNCFSEEPKRSSVSGNFFHYFSGALRLIQAGGDICLGDNSHKMAIIIHNRDTP